MPIAIEQTIHALQIVLQMVPTGTNLALLQLLWSMLNGSFLSSRGAIFPALQVSGFAKDEIRRSWSALRHGMWRIDELIMVWRQHVQTDGQWQRYEYEGYRPVAADITTFWRFRLKGWAGRYFNGIANRLLRGVGLALVADIGHVAGHRLPLLRKLIRAHPKDMSQDNLKALVLDWLARHLAPDEIAIFDAGAHISDMQLAGVPRFVIRLAKNCTARHNYLSTYQRGRPPEYGQLVRPLARLYKGKTLPASQPDKVDAIVHQERTIVVHGWDDLVMADQKVADQPDTFTILVFFDPLYVHPLVLATNVTLSAATAFQLYLDRWPVEQLPLVAKQTLGLGRHFVFAPECCQRLPELALLAGNILTYLAAILPPMPTGFWDQDPKKRRDVCGGSWRGLIFPKMPFLLGNFGKSSRLLAICQRVLRLIDGKNGNFDRFPFFDSCLSHFVNVR
jgi:hypothetical protein